MGGLLPNILSHILPDQSFDAFRPRKTENIVFFAAYSVPNHMVR